MIRISTRSVLAVRDAVEQGALGHARELLAGIAVKLLTGWAPPAHYSRGEFASLMAAFARLAEDEGPTAEYEEEAALAGRMDRLVGGHVGAWG